MQFDPMNPDFQQNPYPYYDELRAKAPVVWSESMQGFCVAQYEDIITVLTQPENFSSSKFWPILLGEYDPAPEVQPMISLDPPDHLRTRTLAQKAFLPRELKKLEEKIEAITDALVEHAISVSRDNTFDMVWDFAALFPVSVIAEMLGIDKSMRLDFKHWVDNLLAASNRAIYDDVRLAEIKHSSDSLRAYFSKIVDERTENPGDDMISTFIKAEVDGERLAKIEVINLAILLLIGGTETTTNLLGGLFAGFHDHPEAFADARADRSLVPQLLEEQLRYQPPVQSLFRHTTKELVLGGVNIPENSLVMPLLGSANRDPEKFPNPNTFDLKRNVRGYCTFGQGPHFCMGNFLSKFEAAIAVNKLFDRFRVLEPLQQPQEVRWIDSYFARGPATLPVRYELA
ncbi:cytochrome P450 [Haliea sp.]|jgi:cytochrome P450|uniref:cytochrome P450 n=1 Tax=Haliea sp. TaxID=1932666 RepID=UPI00257FE546|nr:cytochrome P450 [Haliea sp.]|tara:strand:+ start:12183 stop:13382 length:1200 start_codon:yes stop_codon:yes gene_type:complete